MLSKTIVVAVCLLATTQLHLAQGPLTIDYSYGSSGVAQEHLPAPWAVNSVDAWYAYDDGSAYTVRRGTEGDTVGVVSRLLKNGERDPFYDGDGTIALSAGFTGLDHVLFFERNVFLGYTRLGRYELNRVSEGGEFRSVWQDEEKFVGNRPLAVLPEGRMMMMSLPPGLDNTQFNLRYLTGLQGRLQIEDETLVDTKPTSFASGQSPQAGHIVDRQGKLLLFTTNQNQVVVARVLPNARLDESFGNALGLQVITMPSGQQAQEVSMLHTNEGGYVVTVITRPITESTPTRTIIYRIDPWGKPDPRFGQQGEIHIEGSLMSNRGTFELPNGDLIYLSFGTYAYTHLYHIRNNGSIVPGNFGDFSISPLMAAGRVVANKWVYGLTSLSMVLTRFELDKAVTTVDDNNSSTMPTVAIHEGALHLSNFTQPGVIDFYTVIGEHVAAVDFDPANGAYVAMPSGLPRGPIATVVQSGSFVATVLHCK